MSGQNPSQVLRIIVRGRVQGVGFRYFTAGLAREMALPGWVRNLAGGAVEVLARVDSPQREALLEALKQGPPSARVDELQVRVLEHDADCPATGFTIRF